MKYNKIFFFLFQATWRPSLKWVIWRDWGLSECFELSKLLLYCQVSHHILRNMLIMTPAINGDIMCIYIHSNKWGKIVLSLYFNICIFKNSKWCLLKRFIEFRFVIKLQLLVLQQKLSDLLLLNAVIRIQL